MQNLHVVCVLHTVTRLRLNQMKQHFYSIVYVILLSAGLSPMYAQQKWALAVWEKGMDKPTIMEYHSVAETVENGMEYYRIFDDSNRFRNEAYNPVKLQYGYRWTDKQMFVYDFESHKETLAFDFSLAIGDHFTTFNGIEWIVEVAKDTLVNISFQGKGESVSKKLLTVKTLDGTRYDQWLEGLGSFTNHFMISSMENVEYSQTLWMEYGMGEYLAREISKGPIYAHDSGWLDGAFEASVMPYTVCTYYNNGQLKIEDVQLWYEHRDYICFYRDGDNIQEVYRWEMEPHIDLGDSALRRDVITFDGLPKPESGKYTVHFGNNVFTTSISSIRTNSQHRDYTYDLQGRRVGANVAHGIYISEGKKVYAK